MNAGHTITKFNLATLKAMLRLYQSGWLRSEKIANWPSTADTMVNMALANARLGHCAQAKVKVTKAVSIFKATLGDNHAKTKKWTNFLASVKL